MAPLEYEKSRSRTTCSHDILTLGGQSVVVFQMFDPHQLTIGQNGTTSVRPEPLSILAIHVSLQFGTIFIVPVHKVAIVGAMFNIR